MIAPTRQQLQTEDGHAWELQRVTPAQPRTRLLWLPALGVSARHYLPFAQALAAHGIDVWLHEWRGHGSSNLRASRRNDWGYAALLTRDIPASWRQLDACNSDALPLILGGHSLGGQLTCCLLALQPGAASRAWMVGTGMPWAPAFGPRVRVSLPIATRLVRLVTALRGYWNGHRVGFGGREAKQLMRDWAHTARTGRYAIPSLHRDLDPLLAEVTVPMDGVVLAKDSWAPQASLAYMFNKLGGTTALHVLDDAAVGATADHFTWMRHPAGVAACLAATLPPK